MTDFAHIAILMSLAAALGIIANRLKQPVILAYILAGFILHSTGLLSDLNPNNLQLFSQIGIVFLLFILGLELDIREIQNLGFIALISGLGQIILTTTVAFLVSSLLGYSPIASFYLAIAITFSSTIVIVKLLSHKKDLDTLYGKITVCILLIQDLVAIAILIVLSATTGTHNSILPLNIELILLAVKGVALIALLIFINQLIIPWLIKVTNHDREVLFITIIAWSLLFAAFAGAPFMGFTIEVGALAAGIAISARRESLQIESWTRPLRDFFITVFFVLLGFEIHLDQINNVIGPAIILILFVLIVKPIIIFIIMNALGAKSKVSLSTALTMTQISEFGLLIGNIGLAAGHITQSELTLMTIVGGVSMTASSFLIFHNEQIFTALKSFLKSFERDTQNFAKHKHHRASEKIIIFGFNRLSAELTESIASTPRKFIVIDNEPDAIEHAAALGTQAIYGDLNDEDLLKNLHLDKAKLIISTVPAKQANLNLLYYLRDNDIVTPVIVSAFSDADFVEMYENGATLVLYPHLVTSQKLANLLNRDDIHEFISKIAHHEKHLINKRSEAF